MKNKKFYAMIALVLAVLLGLSGCAGSGGGASAGQKTLSFSEATSFDAIKALDGQQVSIIGYMATLSPISGKYMYLMNMPYQSCPFCVPNSTQLANTMAVYAPSGKTFAFTDQAIRVTGTIRVEDYSDEYGYVYNYRIVDASYETVDLSTVSENYALWQSIAADGVVAEINSMFDYLYFLCQWTEYTSSYTDDDGQEVEFYLYPGDVENYLKDDGLFGFADKAAEGYFPGLIRRLRAIDSTQLEDIAAIVQDAEGVADYALSELKNGRYTYDSEADKYTLTNSEELYIEWYAVYVQFSDWLARWQL